MLQNDESTPIDVIVAQMNELRPLPMGLKEFEEWSDRIIAGAMVKADVESQRYVLANQIMHLGPTEDHKEDAFFMKSLRKFAANQIADAIARDTRDRAKARLAAQEAAAAQETAAHGRS